MNREIMLKRIEKIITNYDKTYISKSDAIKDLSFLSIEFAEELIPNYKENKPLKIERIHCDFCNGKMECEGINMELKSSNNIFIDQLRQKLQELKK